MKRPRNLATICVLPGTSVREIMSLINDNQTGVALMLGPDGRLLRSVTDGDIRRAILQGAELDSSIASQRSLFPQKVPVTVCAGASDAEMLAIMKSACIYQLPILDEERRVVDLVTLNDLVTTEPYGAHAVVMAGGFGTRLQPLTHDTPKPMLPVGNRPLLETIISQLKSAGIGSVNVTTHFLPEVIREHFGDGKRFGVEMNYVNEETPLGTAGALRLIERIDSPLLVMNGDILTNINFRRMKDFHLEQNADLTMAVRPHEVFVPYGVVECDGPFLKSITEKPTLRHFVNAGIYLVGPSAFDFLGDEGRLDMTQLVERLLENNRRVVTFPVTEYWLDIGQMSDYIQAQDDVAAGRVFL